MTARPSKGRYFAVGETEAWREAHRLRLVENQHIGEARVELRNPPSHASNVRELPLLELVGRSRLTIFSLPDRIERALGEIALRQAVEACARHKHELAPATRLKREALIVYFDGQHTSRIAERTTRYQERKYRSTSKFSTAFKLQRRPQRREAAREQHFHQTEHRGPNGAPPSCRRRRRATPVRPRRRHPRGAGPGPGCSTGCSGLLCWCATAAEARAGS